MRSARWVISYILIASVGLWLAFFTSLRFMTTARSQESKTEAPASGDLPPEFLQEMAKSAPAVAPGAPPKDGKIPPPPTGTPQAAASPAPAQNIPPSQPAQMPAQIPTAAAPQAPIQVPPDEQVVPTVPQFAADDQYTYDPTGRRDPFKPYRVIKPSALTGTGGLKTVLEITDPLQKWDILRFDVVAIMWEVRNPRAMVKDPDGKMYMINKNTKIGRNSGHVVAIREGEVVVVENIENEGVQTREVKILELKK